MIEEEIGLDRYFTAVWRAKWLILAGIILAAGAMATIEFNQPTLHTASAVIRVGHVWKEPLEDLYVTTEIANDDGFVQAVASKLGMDRVVLKRQMRAETIIGGPARATYALLVRFIATTERADDSVRIAQAAADELLARHEKLFDQALAPRLKHERRLEELIGEMQIDTEGRTAAENELRDPERYPRKLLKAMGNGRLLQMVRLVREVGEVRLSNSSPIETHKTELVDPVVPGAIIKPAIGRNTLVTALIAALIYIAAAVAFEYFSRMLPHKQSSVVATHVSASARTQPDVTSS